jgi:hypothetical protein
MPMAYLQMAAIDAPHQLHLGCTTVSTPLDCEYPFDVYAAFTTHRLSGLKVGSHVAHGAA